MCSRKFLNDKETLMKKTGALLLLMAAVLVAAPVYNTAWAAQRGPAPGQQGRGPMNDGWRHPDVSPEQQAAFDKIIGEYNEKMRPLQNDLWAKQTELEYLSRSDRADPKDINRMINDIRNLREKCQAVADNTANKLAREFSISTGHAYALLGDCGMGGCAGMGYGHRGMMGNGHRGMGYGPRGHGWDGHGGWGGHRGPNGRMMNPGYYQQQGGA